MYYRAADVLMVTPLRDGLNLVAKEFACVSQSGVLMLSEFAGAAAEMRDALIVNPYDEPGTAAALHQALTLPRLERTHRIGQLRAQVHARDVHVWADTFLSALDPLHTAIHEWPRTVEPMSLGGAVSSRNSGKLDPDPHRSPGDHFTSPR